MVRYKLKNKGDGVEYKPSADKFTERNVRGQGLLVKAEDSSGVARIFFRGGKCFNISPKLMSFRTY